MRKARTLGQFGGANRRPSQAPETAFSTRIRHPEVFGPSRLTFLSPLVLEPCDQCIAGDHQGRAQHPPSVKRVNVHAEPAKLVDDERHEDMVVINSPANGPAPILLTNTKPATTTNAPTIKPPSGAHYGIEVTPASVGNGRGWDRTRQVRKATIGRKEARLPSHGFVKALRFTDEHDRGGNDPRDRYGQSELLALQAVQVAESSNPRCKGAVIMCQ